MARHFLAPLVAAPTDPWVLAASPTGVVVASRVVAAFDSAARRSGLLGTDAWPEGSALVIAPTQAIHMFGMRYAIDVVWVDRAGAVLKAATVRPWRIAICARAFAAIELPAGTAARLGIAAGATLALQQAA